MTPSEELVAEFNRDIFLREFSFANTRFTAGGQTEIELADHIVWIDDLLMIFQIKERGNGTNDDAWFKHEVLNRGTRQVRDTLRFLRETPNLVLTNQRGHTISIGSWSQLHVVKIVLYFSRATLGNARSHHVSSTAGFIHIISGGSYLDICRTLTTPSEIHRYLQYREALALAGQLRGVSERAALGQWLLGEFTAEPHERYASAVESLVPPQSMSRFVSIAAGMGEHLYTPLTTEPPSPSYYHVLAELAKLDRNEVGMFLARFDRARQASRANEFAAPWRFVAESGCGFLFLPVVNQLFDGRVAALEKFTLACKYDLKLRRQVGLAIAVRGEELVVDWYRMDGDWEYDSVLEKEIQSAPALFRAIHEEQVLLYRFQTP